MSGSSKEGGASGGGIQHFWRTANASPLPRIERAEGVYLWDTSGRRYLDATSGPVAVNLGHGNLRVLHAMKEQAARVSFAYPSYFESESNIRLGDQLAQLTGLDRAFFVSSGSEAVEKCIQFARLHALATGQPERYKIVSRDPSYHGSTLFTAALSGDSGYKGLQPLMPVMPRVPAPFSYRQPEGFNAESYAAHCAEALAACIEKEGPGSVLAFIVEPVMGFSGGASYASETYYARVRQICDQHGVLLIYDETISGAGRTGKFLAAHWWPQARPDLVILAKGLGGGYYPLAAFLAPARMVAAVVNAGGFHLGHTHKASPLACAVGLAVLEETVKRDLINRAGQVGNYLRDRLNGLKDEIAILGDVRGLGMLNAIEIVADRASKAMLPRELDVLGQFQAIARSNGLLIYGRRTHGGRFGDWIMVTPPLIATPAEVDEIVQGLAQSLRAYQDELKKAGHLR